MKKIYLFCALWSLLSSASVCAQSTSWSAPDSAAVVTKPGSGPNPGWTISNPLMHNGSAFITGPMSQGFMDNTSDYLYLYDLGLNIPSNATITGVELIISRGGCNGGNHAEDTVSLAFNGAAIGNFVADSVPASGSTDTLGSSTDTWGNSLTPAMVNDYRFGVWYSYQSFGICTFVVFDCRVKVHYTVSTTGISSVAESKSLRIFPNPATSIITVSAEHFIITDQAGRTVLSSAASTADVSSLAPGLYFIRHNNSVAKFIKQ